MPCTQSLAGPTARVMNAKDADVGAMKMKKRDRRRAAQASIDLTLQKPNTPSTPKSDQKIERIKITSSGNKVSLILIRSSPTQNNA